MSNRKYSEADKKNAALIYWETHGAQRETAKRTGISRGTIQTWIESDQVFLDALQTINAEFDKRFISRCTAIMEKGLEALELKVNDPKTNVRDLAYAVAVCSDRRQLFSNRPTYIRGNSESMEKRLKEMEQRLTSYGDKKNKAKDKENLDVGGRTVNKRPATDTVSELVHFPLKKNKLT
jgi:transposase-like protein